MFDKITYKTETKETPVTRVIEKSITPDKVVEMYDQAEKEAEKRIIRRMSIKNNLISGSVVEMQLDEKTASNKIYIRFQLNGEEIILEETFQHGKLYGYPEVLELFISKFSNQLVQKLVDRDWET